VGKFNFIKEFMMQIVYEIFNHSGTMIDTFEITSQIIPRAGEIVV
jgi:hypothetical protein